METLKIKPGSILLWKEYSKITKMFSKLFHTDLSYNKFHYITDYMTLCFPITRGNNDYDGLVILEPRKDYTKEEVKLLNSLIVFDADCWTDSLKIFTNTVRPNSIEINSDLDDLLWNENYKIAYDFSKKN